MKFTMEATELYKLLNRIKPLATGSRYSVFNQGMSGTGTDCALLEVRGKTVVEATATSDAQTWMQVKGKADVSEPGRVVVPIFKLMRCLKPFAGEVMEFSTFTEEVEEGWRGNKKMVVRDRLRITLDGPSKVAIQMRLGSESAFISMPFPRTKASTIHKIPVGALEEVAWAASTDESRPVLTHLCIGDGSIVATDSYRLHVVELPSLAGTPKTMVPARLVKILKDEKIKEAHISVYDSGDIAIASDDMTLFSRCWRDGDFPKWRTLIPESPSASMGGFGDGFFDTMLRFRSVIESFSTGGRYAQHHVSFESDGAEIVMRHKGDDGYSAESRLKGTLETPVSFQIRYLVDALKGTNAGSLFGATSTTPWGLQEDCIEYEAAATRLRVIMPVRTS